ncbi:hypothetical protein A2858_03680 [Candidatus Daviesbacteria bacterium RIFCSPHIGHO2_01_FULL_36_37]|nr:MAG: hypothetical protein A2858_03680 [Candidatus Daviesbacteria bacterium RIFCSPHIGHO2_01_FULL_36_37]
MKNSLSVIIPAYNEEENLEDSIKSVLRIVPEFCNDFEIVIINDGSKDETGKIANRLAKNKKIKVIHNSKNKGMGYSYWRGVSIAKYNYIMIVWGDYAHTDSSLKKILSYMRKYEVVIPFYTNMDSRTVQRRIISAIFSRIVNLITGLSIRYYNGSTLYMESYLKKIPRHSQGFGYQAEILAYTIKQGAKYIEVGVERRNIPDGPTAAFAVKNVSDVMASLLWLFKEFRILPLKRLIIGTLKYVS